MLEPVMQTKGAGNSVHFPVTFRKSFQLLGPQLPLDEMALGYLLLTCLVR